MSWFDRQEKLYLESKGLWSEGIELITAPQLGIGVEDVWTNKYVYSAYQQGIFRARRELQKSGYKVPSIAESGGLGVALNQPMHIDRLGLVYSRTYEELKGINASMSSQISRVLSQGMAEGRNPRELAIILASTVMGPVGGLGITDTLGRFIPAARRAEIMARTEIIRAHHVATIQEYRNWGLEGVQVQGEWATAGDDRVCDECASLEGKIFTLEEIESMIPRHPQCRCIALPIEEKDVAEHNAERERLEQEKIEQEKAEQEKLKQEKAKKTTSSFGSSDVENQEFLGGGVNETQKVIFEDGTAGVFKRVAGESDWLRGLVDGDLYTREVAAYKVDKILGLDIVPETIIWKDAAGNIGSLQKWVDNAQTAAGAPSTLVSFAQGTTSYHKMKILDALICNTDRHKGNWMITGSTVDLRAVKVIPIDHGASFANDPLKTASALGNQFEYMTSQAVKAYSQLANHIQIQLKDKFNAVSIEGLRTELTDLLGAGPAVDNTVEIFRRFLEEINQ